MARRGDSGNCFGRRPTVGLAAPSVAYTACYPVADLARADVPAYVSRTDAMRDRCVYCLLDRSRRIVRAEVAEHHRDRKDGSHRIRHVLACEGWRAPVHR